MKLKRTVCLMASIAIGFVFFSICHAESSSPVSTAQQSSVLEFDVTLEYV